MGNKRQKAVDEAVREERAAVLSYLRGEGYSMICRGRDLVGCMAAMRDAIGAIERGAHRPTKTEARCVHTEHCCRVHGCKYGDEDDCPVQTGKKLQSFPCEYCETDYDED